MKQKLYILGVVTSLIIVTGTLFKVSHLPGAAILLTAGIFTLIVLFIPAALINNYRAKEPRQNLLLYIVTWLTCFVVFAAMLFKILHWPYAGTMLLVALPFPYIVFLPVFLRVTSKDKNSNIYNVVFVLSLLAFNSVFSALLSLNVSKTRIEDSYNLSRNYNNIEKAMKQLPEGGPETAVDLKIGEVLKTINEYKGMILNYEGISLEQWTARPGNLWRPEAGAVAAGILKEKEGPDYGVRLETGMKNLIAELESAKGYGNFSKIVPSLLSMSIPEGSESTWSENIFRDNTLSWALIYLDALEANLYMIKASVAGTN